MQVEIFTLCDAASTGSGKLNIMGALDTVCSAKEPIRTPPMTLVARMRFMKLEEGEKRVQIAIVDADGQEMCPRIDATIPMVNRVGEATSTANITLSIQQLKLPRFGEYAVDLAVNGRQEASIPVYARQIPKPEIKCSENDGQFSSGDRIDT